jgi:ribosomal protein S18 acetylase RimI-like enzyme
VFYRQAEIADVSGMARIRALGWGEPEYWQNRLVNYLFGEQNPREALSPRIAYVAAEENAVAGFIAGHLTRRYSFDGELQWISVLPERRGSGVASELLRLLATWFADQGALKICVDVEPSNTAARAFYLRHGAEKLNPHWLVWNDTSAVLKPIGSSRYNFCPGSIDK